MNRLRMSSDSPPMCEINGLNYQPYKAVKTKTNFDQKQQSYVLAWVFKSPSLWNEALYISIFTVYFAT